jgi:hypothetical protein
MADPALMRIGLKIVMRTEIRASVEAQLGTLP